MGACCLDGRVLFLGELYALNASLFLGEYCGLSGVYVLVEVRIVSRVGKVCELGGYRIEG